MHRRSFLKNIAIGGGLLSIAPHLVFSQTVSPLDGKADWIYSGGMIYTSNPKQPIAQAVAVRGNQIVYVGDANGVDAWKGTNTKVVNLGGGMLLPGFIDAHDHLATLAITKLGINLGGMVGKEKVLNAIREWIAKQPPNAPLRGYGWVLHDTFGEEYPRREWLDEITGDRPMYLLSSDIHETWFNTAAMKAAGISASSPDPDPGRQYFKRDPDGTPSGLAIEGAAFPILITCGMTSRETVRESQRLTIDRAPSMGMTSYCDAGLLLSNKNSDATWVMEDLVKRDKAGELQMRIVGSVFTRNPNNDPYQIIAELSEWNKQFKSEHIKVNACKMWTDGTFIAGTGKLLQPFADGSPGGEMFFNQKQIEAQIEAAEKSGFDMHIHADGDGSVRTVLNAFEAVQKRGGSKNHRHTMCHMSLVSPSDLPRFKKLGLFVNGTPLWATDYNGVDYERYRRMLGVKRFEESLLPYGDMVRSGAIFTIGADLGGVDVSEIPPLLQLEAAVTRQRPGHPNDNIMVKRQRISVAQALQAYTINAAYQMRMDKEVGSIAVGKKADMVFLEKNIFNVPHYQIHETKIVQTMMDGKITHTEI